MGKIISNGINYSGIIHEYSPAIYSTEEREIGVWIDGKPLYKKVVVFSESIQVTYTSIFDTTIDSSDIENIITAVGIHADGTNYAGMLADPTRSNHTIIGLQTGRNDTYANVKKLILEYTKISDSPGSGTWTPSGVPAVHYSTEEQVVGTWIDGSTLYEKTIEYSCEDSTEVQTAYTLTNENIKVVVDAVFENSVEDQIRNVWAGAHFWSYVITRGVISVRRDISDTNWKSGVKFRITIQYTKSTT